MAVASAATALAVKQGARLVMSPASRVYLDMKDDATTRLGLNWAGYVELRDAYGWDPAGLFPGVTEANVLGVEAPLWTETIVTMADLETMVLPRLPAVAEIGWSAQASRSWDAFRARVAMHGVRWDAMRVEDYRVAAGGVGRRRSASPTLTGRALSRHRFSERLWPRLGTPGTVGLSPRRLRGRVREAFAIREGSVLLSSVRAGRKGAARHP